MKVIVIDEEEETKALPILLRHLRACLAAPHIRLSEDALRVLRHAGVDFCRVEPGSRRLPPGGGVGERF